MSEIQFAAAQQTKYVMLQLHRMLTQQLDLKTVVEVPSHSANAACSLYPIGFAHAGCDVTLVNPELEMMYKWEEIGLQDKAYGNSNAPDPDKMKPDWGVPIIDYTKEDKYPLWMRALGKWDMAFRKGVLKLPMSHLFYELGSDDASEH